jgi:hypothetical protein
VIATEPVAGSEDADILSFLVLSNATEGDDDVFNEWYSNRHIVDVIEQVPGVRTIQRFRLAEAQRKPGPYAYRYLCIYRVERAHAAAAFTRLEARSGTLAMPVSDTFESYLPLVFEPLAPAIRQDDFPHKFDGPDEITSGHPLLAQG